MNVVNCSRCGKLFQHNGISNYCPLCVQEDEENFKRIKDYLYNYPKSTVMEVAEALDIAVKQIKHYLREGRLEVVDAENFFLDCERCGVPIRSGHYCEKCMRELNSGVKKLVNTAGRNAMERRHDSGRMRYLNNEGG